MGRRKRHGRRPQQSPRPSPSAKQIADCRGKVRFETEREADDAAYRKRMQEGVRLSHYRCQWCEGWHLTSRIPG